MTDQIGDPEEFAALVSVLSATTGIDFVDTQLMTEDGVITIEGLMLTAPGENPQRFLIPRQMALYLFACISVVMEQYGWDVAELQRDHGS